MKRLPAVSSDWRIRLEGALEQVEFAVEAQQAHGLARDPKALLPLAARWAQIETAAHEVAKHPELAEVSAVFEGSRATLEADSRKECELLGLSADAPLSERLERISRAHKVMATLPALEVAQSPQYAVGRVLMVTFAAVSAALIARAAGAGFFATTISAWLVGSLGHRLWKGTPRWVISGTHVVVKAPRPTAIAIADIDETSATSRALVVKSGSQVLTLESSEPRRLQTLLQLLRDGAQLVPYRMTRTTTRGATAILDVHGVTVVPQSESTPASEVLGRFEPRAIATTLGAPWWPASQVVARSGAEATRFELPNGDSFTVSRSDTPFVLREAIH